MILEFRRGAVNQFQRGISAAWSWIGPEGVSVVVAVPDWRVAAQQWHEGGAASAQTNEGRARSSQAAEGGAVAAQTNPE